MPDTDVNGNIYTTDPIAAGQVGFTLQPMTGGGTSGVTGGTTGGVSGLGGVNPNPTGGGVFIDQTAPNPNPNPTGGGFFDGQGSGNNMNGDSTGFNFGMAPIHRDPTPFYAQGTGYDATTYNPANYTAAQTNVTGDQLTSNQLNGLLSSDNPYIQNARARANEAGSARGLLNSSITAGAGEAAAINAALPIAQNDAQRYGNVADNNTLALNNSYFQNATFAQNANSDNASALTAADRYSADVLTKTDADNADRFNDRTDTIMDNEFEWDSASQRFRNQGILNDQAQTFVIDRAAIEHALKQDWANFEQGTDLTDEARGVANTLIQSYGNSMSMIGTSSMTPAEQTTAITELRDMIPGLVSSWALIYEQFGADGEYANIGEQLDAILGGSATEEAA